MKWALVATVAVLLIGAARAQTPASSTAQTPISDPQVLYRELRSVGLDSARVYRVRDVTLDRESLHLAFSDGVIAFTTAVNGRITGAFFDGDGEVLISPPSKVERASMARFTGAAILEERFTTAYLRFNDDTFKQFEPALRALPAPEAADFVSRWDGVARTLADREALRLLRTFVNSPSPNDRMLRARLSGVHFGTFDVFYDAALEESISVGQVTHVDAGAFYDVWTSYAPPSRGAAAEPPPAGVRISRYTIRAHVVPPHDLEATTELTLDSANGGQRLLLFELSRYLKVSSIELAGAGGATPVQFIQNEALEGTQLARRGNDVVAVILPRPLVAGGRTQLKFTYAGEVMSEAGGGLMYVGARGTWYPNRGLDMADFDMEFRSPANWVLLATGKRTSNETVGAEQVSHWVSEHPMPLAGFNVGHYDHASAKASGVTITAYAARGVENSFPNRQSIVITPPPPPPIIAGRKFPPDHTDVYIPPPMVPSAYAQRVADLTAHTVEWGSRRLGTFPFTSLALTQMPGTASQGWPGLVFLSSYVFMAEEERTQRQLSPVNALLYRQLMPAHETIHQWWGDLVLWRSYHDQWMIEAISNYLALVSLEKEHPDDLRLVLDNYRTELLKKNSDGDPTDDAGPVTLGVRLFSSKFPDAYEPVAYGRGTWLIHMLREMLRDAPPAAKSAKGRAEARDTDELFFSALRTLLEQNRYKRISTADLQKAFEAVLPTDLRYEGEKSLDWFFDGWVNGTAIPHYELADVKFAIRGGRTVATGKLLQNDAPKSLVTSVPIYASTATKPVSVGRIFADGDETSFRFTVPAGTRKLLIDPNGTVLSK